MDKQQQYKWRKHRKNKRILTAWFVCVGVLSAAGAFVYQGTYDSNPQKSAERYIKNVKNIEDYTLQSGDRSLSEEGKMVQTFTFTYTPKDSKDPVTGTVDLVRQDKKRYGMFERWVSNDHVDEAKNVKITVPVDSKVMLDQKALDSSLVKEDEKLTAGAKSYVVPYLEKKEYTLTVTGLPFENYESKWKPDQDESSIDVRGECKLSENAKTQMQELGKQVLKEFFSAAVQKQTVQSLGAAFDKVKDKETLLKTVTGNLFSDPGLVIEQLEFSGFNSSYGEPYFPDANDESYIGIEVKTKYNCKYSGTRIAEGEDGDTETEESQSYAKEAKFYFIYQGGKCYLKSMELPNLF